MAKPVDVKRDADKRELTIDELNAVTGGDAKPAPPPQSNLLKKFSETQEGISANIK